MTAKVVRISQRIFGDGTLVWCIKKFVEEFLSTLTVMPAKAGIQKSLKILDSGSRYPGL